MFYPNLEAERARNRMTKPLLAEALGIAEKTLYNWNRNGTYPDWAFQKMAEMFHCDVEYLKEVEEEC